MYFKYLFFFSLMKSWWFFKWKKGKKPQQIKEEKPNLILITGTIEKVHWEMKAVTAVAINLILC